MTNKSRRAKLVRMLKKLDPEMKAKLNELKKENSNLKRPDFIWHYLLQSFATMGNTGGWPGLIGNKQNYNQVTFQALMKLKPPRRALMIERVMRRAKVRWPKRKSEWLRDNLAIVNGMGGLECAKKMAISEPDTKTKIAFMCRFRGIGKKYARNIWMDVYHPDFHNSIAIDQRIKSLTKILGYEFRSFEEHEQFYLKIAKEAGLQGWELDRLVYNFTKRFMQCLKDE